jgi:hypothetical protein
MLISVDETGGGGEPVQFNEARHSGGGSKSDNFTYIFVFIGSIIICWLYKLTFSEQAQVSLHWKQVSDLV